MLARLRSFLDEATADLYNDTTELYPALSLAQQEIAHIICINWYNNGREQFKPIPLAVTNPGMITTATGTIASGSNNFAVTDVIALIFAYWDPTNTAPRQCVFAGNSGSFRQLLGNSLLSGGWYASWNGSKVFLNPISSDASASYTVEYFNEPADISSSVQPSLGDIAHDAVIERACWILLKDRESEQANVHLQIYAALMKGLME